MVMQHELRSGDGDGVACVFEHSLQGSSVNESRKTNTITYIYDTSSIFRERDENIII